MAVLLAIAAGALGVFPLYHTFTQDLSEHHQGKITGAAGVAAWILPAQAQLLFGLSADRLGTMDPGLEGKDGAMTGRGFDAPGNIGGSGIGAERALEAIIPSPRAQRESIPLFELPCERRPHPQQNSTQAERDRPGARFGSEHPDLWREAPRLKLPRASLWAKGRSRGAPQRQPTSLMSRCHSLPSLTRTAEPSCR